MADRDMNRASVDDFASQPPATESVEVMSGPVEPPSLEPAGQSGPDAACGGPPERHAGPPPHEQPTVISDRPCPEVPMPDRRDGNLQLGREMEGQTLAHYRLEQFVGGGGMGAVFRATDLKLERTVAVKVLLQDSGTDEDTVRRFKNEAQSAARLDHENIARVYDVGEEQGLNYIAFEFIEGVNVRDLVQRGGPLSLDTAVSYVMQVAEALAHASERDVVHRDIKPSNVIVSAQGRVKLVDMGLARLQQVHAEGDDLTATGVTLGTYDYISPEQARDPRNADVRSDLYSLGCTFYFMLTARPPFPDGTVLQKLLSHNGEQPADPRSLRHDIPDRIAEIINRLLAKRPADRYENPRELIGELLLAASQLNLRTTPHAGTVLITHKSPELSVLERHLPWVAPVAVLFLVVLSLDWLWPSRGANDEDLPRFVAPPVALGSRTPRQDRQAPMLAAPPESVEPRPLGDESSSRAASISLPPSESDGVPHVAAAPYRHSVRRVPPSIPTEANLAAGTNGSNPSFTTGSVAEATSPMDPANTSSNRTIVEYHAEDGIRESAGGEPGTSTSAEVFGHAPETRVTRPDLLVVGDFDASAPWDKALYSSSLYDACRKAERLSDVKVIELRYDGRGSEPERPLTLANKDLVIRAGDGFKPVVVFRPELDPGGMHARTMVRVVGGQLLLEGIQFEMQVPAEPTEGWELFQLEQVELLSFDRCVVTIDNADSRHASYRRGSFHEQVTMIDLDVPPGREMMMDPIDHTMDVLTEIRLRNCIVRGEASVVRAAEALPFRFRWTNGLLVTTDEMVKVGGSVSELLGGDLVNVDLDHVTAVMDRGLMRIHSDYNAPYTITFDVNCTDSILVVDPAQPLIEHHCSDGHTLSQLDSQLFFSGEGNFYENVDVFWRRRVTSTTGNEEGDQDELRFEDWKDRWDREDLPRLNKVIWAHLPSPGLPVSRHLPEDYYLSDRHGNRAIDSARGPVRRNAGFDPSNLPSPFSEDVPPPGKVESRDVSDSDSLEQRSLPDSDPH